MTDLIDTIVIGGGPAGLTCAYTLAKHRREVLVLESDPTYVGGISRTVNYNGFLFDIGGHRFFSKSKEILTLWRELLPHDFIERPRLSRIYYQGQLYSYPLKAFESFRKLGIIESFRCLLSFAFARLKPIKNPHSFHDWVRNQFGERLFNIFFKSYTEKVWGIDCDEISADWAAQRIKGLSLGTALIDAFRRSMKLKQSHAVNRPKTLTESFQYPRKGPGMMWEAAARAMETLGGKILLGRTVRGLAYDASSATWSVSVTLADGRTEQFQSRHIVSSAAIRDLASFLSPRSSILVDAAEHLSYRDFITVVLIGTRDQYLPDNWIYIHDPSVRVGRVQNFRSWSPEMIPDKDSVCLGLEYFCFEGDGLWTSSDRDLIQLAKCEISKLGLMDSSAVRDACVVRQCKAYPVYDPGYKERVNKVREQVKREFPSLHLVGRNGMHKYNNQDHAMMTGLLTALNIIAGRVLYDVWGVNEDAEYLEHGPAGVEEALTSERLVPSRAAAATSGLS